MKYDDFRIGCEFRTGSGKRWRCTDKGTRVIVAIHFDKYPDDPTWSNGPPYALEEMVFDEYAQEDCVGQVWGQGKRRAKPVWNRE